jgi:hypothetical protein
MDRERRNTSIPKHRMQEEKTPLGESNDDDEPLSKMVKRTETDKPGATRKRKTPSTQSADDTEEKAVTPTASKKTKPAGDSEMETATSPMITTTHTPSAQTTTASSGSQHPSATALMQMMHETANRSGVIDSSEEGETPEDENTRRITRLADGTFSLQPSARTRTNTTPVNPSNRMSVEEWHIPRRSAPPPDDDDEEEEGIDEDPTMVMAFHTEKYQMTLEEAMRPIIFGVPAWRSWVTNQRLRGLPYYDMIGVPYVRTHQGQTLSEIEASFWAWVAATLKFVTCVFALHVCRQTVGLPKTLLRTIDSRNRLLSPAQYNRHRLARSIGPLNHRRAVQVMLLGVLLVEPLGVFQLPLTDDISTVSKELRMWLPRVLGNWISQPLHEEL